MLDMGRNSLIADCDRPDDESGGEGKAVIRLGRDPEKVGVRFVVTDLTSIDRRSPC
ncbi:hypothetical protein UA75_12535 [Actinoalloteichus sp. GBA129-24]|uniref:Uncharacterized protein n=1 Tax=Actinoalloteichus fjordicus TaxID=1612552 RepID=A0AAC9LBI1_9PSEU|nr:hypothetical protein UA74_12455 [Actinoalloteichus fjordicus]APU20519.1 hypothetical protein UA75_12535 [Actinoalloteichus sp. GBA129-24]